MSAGAITRRLGSPARAAARPLLREQALVAGAQLFAGVGNLAFALLAARVLAPAAFGDLVAFLALYLLLHVPMASLSAGSALRPALAGDGRRRALRLGAGAGIVIAAAAWPLAPVLGVSAGMLVAFAAAAPAAGWLALERGRLYAGAAHRRVAASLAAEPLARLGLGLPLAALLGPVGAAVGVVAGGWLALAATRPRVAGETHPTDAAGGPTGVARRDAWLAAAAFLALAVLQNQDVLLANARLDGDAAGHFAVLSTLGGVAAFATTTIPLVLLPRARAGARGALTAALAAAAGLGAAAIAVVALLPGDLVTTAFGEDYAPVAQLVVPYVAAMALLGIVRVLVADATARGNGRRTAVMLALVAAAQAAATIAIGDTPRAIAVITLVAMLAATAGAAILRFPIERAATAERRGPRLTRHGLAVLGLMLFALILRLTAARSLWLDEATSITQAQMPFGQMLDGLRVTDVHPPLHHVLLWVLAHTAGTAELVMRTPSILAGVALVGVLYLLGRELYDRRTGLVAAALGCVAPFALWYSQEARMYALFMLFAAVAVLGQLLVLRRGRPQDWALYGLATIALLWTQYFGILLVAVQQAGFLLFFLARRREGEPTRALLIGWGATAVVIAAAVAPLIPYAMDQFEANQAAGKGFGAPSQTGSAVDPAARQPGVYVVLTNLVWAVWGYHSSQTMAAVTALWPLGILLALLLLGRGRSPRTFLVVACALVPALVLFALGMVKPFLFEIRYFAGAVPLLLVLVARAVTAWAPGRFLAAGVAALLFGSFAVASADQQVNRSNPRLYDFEGTVAALHERVRPGDAIVYEPHYLRDVLGYYGSDLPAAPLRDGLPGDDARRVVLVASFQDKAEPRANVREALARLQRTRDVVDTFERPQVRVWVLR